MKTDFAVAKKYQQIKGWQMVIIDRVGHLPQIAAFGRFITPFKAFLDAQ